MQFSQGSEHLEPQRVGMLFLGDEVSVLKIFFVITLITCIMGLKFISNKPEREEVN